MSGFSVTGLTAGAVHTVSTSLWVETGVSVALSAGSVTGPTITASPTWQPVSIQFTPTGTTATVSLVNISGFGKVYMDNLSVVKGVYTGPHFDGTTQFVSGQNGSWNGTPDASTSKINVGAGSLPSFGAQYTLTQSDPARRKLTLLIPTDRDLHLGFSGSATNGAVLRVQPVTRDGGYAPISDLVLLDPVGSTRLNAKFAGGAYSAVQVYMATTGVGNSTITLVSGKAIYAKPTDTVVLTGEHIQGQGHSGLRFSDDPTLTYTMAANGKVIASAAAKFTEIGSWL